MNILSIIGTIASIGSIPLSFYFYLKSNEKKQETLRRDILNILLHKIAGNKKLSLFEITSVLKSKLKALKLKTNFLLEEEIIEELVSNILSNPFISTNKKDEHIKSLEAIKIKYEEIGSENEDSRKSYMKSLSTLFISIAGTVTIILGLSSQLDEIGLPLSERIMDNEIIIIYLGIGISFFSFIVAVLVEKIKNSR